MQPPTTDHQRFGLPHELQSIYIVMDAKYVGSYVHWSLMVCFSCWKLPRTHKIRMRESLRTLTRILQRIRVTDSFMPPWTTHTLFAMASMSQQDVAELDHASMTSKSNFHPILTSTSSDTERFAIRPTHPHVASLVCSFHNNRGVKTVDRRSAFSQDIQGVYISTTCVTKHIGGGSNTGLQERRSYY